MSDAYDTIASYVLAHRAKPAEFKCDTCRDTGEVDEMLGGECTSDPHAPCPDCQRTASHD